MDYQHITTPTDAALPAVQALYENSFPIEERRHFHQLVSMLGNDAMTCIAVWDEGEVIAMMVYWQLATCCYVEHLAVHPEKRGKQYGKRIIEWLLATAGTQPVLLEVEPPADEWSMRRIGFYERLGFVLLPYDYQQPSYHEPGRFYPLKIMMQAPIPDETGYNQMIGEVYRVVYGVTE